ncbi:tetratricopeptide repeat protein [Paenibacillus sp. CECT 9249]|uniref:tetratricopeptide repeat protein n=1 Tax=unclassified Paenibacillus TaxID=185978 RepID=UPI001C11057A|nr:tetratricopeptide repeat protein [Paenibacillus sp. CECT 9249]MBU5443997.1 tetratricopeptide repeat protein [Paenibacillus sp. MSJ-34]CAH0118778.1 hypothetical protein PAE9249_01272 [Paenibacillus sp. CECT 9249]
MNADEMIKQAYHSILQGDFGRAVYWFEQAILLDGNHPDYHYKLSITYARSGRLQQAIVHAKRASDLQPEHEKYRLHLQHLQAKERIEEAENYTGDNAIDAHAAIHLLRQAVELDPLAVRAYVLMAEAYAKLQDYHQAIRCLGEARKLDPDNETVKVLYEDWKQKLAKDLEIEGVAGDHAKN